MNKAIKYISLFLLLICQVSIAAGGKNIFFELDDILFETGSLKSLKKSGSLTKLIPKSSLEQSVVEYRRNLFSLLSAYNPLANLLLPELNIYYKGDALPPLWCAYLLNLLEPQDAYDKARKELESKLDWHNFVNKEIFLSAIEVAFDPSKEVEVTTPIFAGWELVEKCIANTENRVFIFSNKNIYVLSLLKLTYPDFFAKFEDSIIISGETKRLKPDPNTYAHILDDYGIDANSCYFIESEEQHKAIIGTTLFVKNKDFTQVISHLVENNIISE